MNNSHIVIFDIHSEYRTAFPKANVIGVDDLLLPFWLLNAEEMEEMFLESGDNNNYNQASLLRTIVTLCKERTNPTAGKVYFDSPLPYKVQEVVNCLLNLTRETKDADNALHVRTKADDKTFSTDDEKLKWYCEASREFALPNDPRLIKAHTRMAVLINLCAGYHLRLVIRDFNFYLALRRQR